MNCADHWHCCATLAAHTCNQPNRLLPCPTCGAATVTVTDIHVIDDERHVAAQTEIKRLNKEYDDYVMASAASHRQMQSEIDTAIRERDEARKERDYGIEIQTRQVEDNRRLERERDEAVREMQAGKTVNAGHLLRLSTARDVIAQRDRRIAELEAALREIASANRLHGCSPDIAYQAASTQSLILAEKVLAAPATDESAPCRWCGHKWAVHDWGDGSCSNRACACRDYAATKPGAE